LVNEVQSQGLALPTAGRAEGCRSIEAPLLPPPTHGKYRELEVAAQPIFNIRKVF
jgi:hypothetical protein